MIRIKIEGKNIADIWRLKCVKDLHKLPDDKMAVRVNTKWGKTDFPIHANAYISDIIEVESEQSETGSIIYHGR